MENIENIFRTAETEKSIEVSPHSWNKLDNMLENQEDKKSKFSWRPASMVACFIFLLGMTFNHFYQQMGTSQYELQSLEISDDGHTHLENIHLLYGRYDVKSKALNDARMTLLN